MSQAIGKRLQLGYAGSLTRSGDAIVVNRVSAGTVPFGGGLFITPDNRLAPTGAEPSFVGFAKRIVKQQQSIHEAAGSYNEGELMDVLVRGSIAVPWGGAGTPTAGGSLYIRTAPNASMPNAKIGDVEAAADGTNTILIGNARFTTGIVEYGLVEVTVTERRI